MRKLGQNEHDDFLFDPSRRSWVWKRLYQPTYQYQCSLFLFFPSPTNVSFAVLDFQGCNYWLPILRNVHSKNRGRLLKEPFIYKKRTVTLPNERLARGVNGALGFLMVHILEDGSNDGANYGNERGGSSIAADVPNRLTVITGAQNWGLSADTHLSSPASNQSKLVSDRYNKVGIMEGRCAVRMLRCWAGEAATDRLDRFY